MEWTELKTRDTKEENTGRRKNNHPAPINTPDDGRNGDLKDGTRTNNAENKQTLTNQREPCKLMYLNARGLINKYTRWKIDDLKEYVSTNNIILMNFTETWLKKKIQDVKVPNFTTFRCDRKSKKKKGGGVAIYLKNGFEARLLLEERVESCEILAIHIEKLNIINIVIYRPPDTHSTEFASVMDKIKKLLTTMTSPEPSVIISGDFNFPFVEWRRGDLNACKWRMKIYSNAKEDEKKQFHKLIDIMDSFHLVQTIQEPTRKENTLDLVFTNNTSLFKQIEETKTNLALNIIALRSRWISQIVKI